MMGMRVAGAFVLCATSGGCGAEIVVPGDGGAGGSIAGSGGSLVLPPPPNVQQDEGCPELLVVPAGDAWVGSFRVDEAFSLSPLPCDGCCLGSKRFRVPGVYVDSDEITNACYAHCVDDGSCTPPPASDGPAWDSMPMADFPVAATIRTAEALCAWRGGRMPSVGELARASHGATVGVTTMESFERTRACWEARRDGDGETSVCDYLKTRGSVQLFPGPVRDAPGDVGPFGHRDLFGSRCDLTATSWQLTDTESDAYCAREDGSTDPGTFGSDLTYRARFCPATILDSALPWAPGGALIDATAFNMAGDLPDAGIRCAFDPVMP